MDLQAVSRVCMQRQRMERGAEIPHVVLQTGNTPFYTHTHTHTHTHINAATVYALHIHVFVTWLGSSSVQNTSLNAIGLSMELMGSPSSAIGSLKLTVTMETPASTLNSEGAPRSAVAGGNKQHSYYGMSVDIVMTLCLPSTIYSLTSFFQMDFILCKHLSFYVSLVIY